jgi:hypothetical protein
MITHETNIVDCVINRHHFADLKYPIFGAFLDANDMHAFQIYWNTLSYSKKLAIVSEEIKTATEFRSLTVDLN